MHNLYIFFQSWFAVKKLEVQKKWWNGCLKKMEDFFFHANPLFHHIACDSCMKAGRRWDTSQKQLWTNNSLQDGCFLFKSTFLFYLNKLSANRPLSLQIYSCVSNCLKDCLWKQILDNQFTNCSFKMFSCQSLGIKNEIYYAYFVFHSPICKV